MAEHHHLAGNYEMKRSEFLKKGAALGGALVGGASLVKPRSAWARAGRATSQTLTVGVEAPFTGDQALIGQNFKTAVSMAFETINYKVGPYAINVIWVDDQADPAAGVAAYEHAIVAQGMQVGLLNWDAEVGVAVMNVAAKYKIPHLFGFAGATEIDQKFNSDRAKYGYYMCKGWPDFAKLTKTYIEAVTAAIGAGTLKVPTKEIALWGEDTTYGLEDVDALKSQFAAAGWKIVSTDFFPQDQTDFTALLTRYKNEKVPVLAGTVSASVPMTDFVKQASQLGVAPPGLLIADGLSHVGNWYQLTGSASNGVVDQYPKFIGAAGKQFASTFQSRAKLPASPTSSGLPYDWTIFFTKVLQQTYKDHGTLDSQSIYETAVAKLWTGQLTHSNGIVMHEYKFTPQTIPDPVVGPGYFIFPVVQYHNGNPVTVYPPQDATGKLALTKA